VRDDLSWGIKHALLTKKQGLIRSFSGKYPPVKNQKYQLKQQYTLELGCGSKPLSPTKFPLFFKRLQTQLGDKTSTGGYFLPKTLRWGIKPT
jgi:hypothetical protein